MNRLAKAMSAFNFGRSGSADGRDARPFAGRGAPSGIDGSGAPSHGQLAQRRAIDLPYRLSLVAMALGLVALVALAVAPAASAAPKGVAGFIDTASTHGIAINKTGAGPADLGDIYVLNFQGGSAANKVERYSSIGKFERRWGKDVIKPGATVDTDLGDGYEICTFAEDCQEPANAFSSARGGEFIGATGIAINQTNGNVYVVERNNSGGARVQAFDGDGGFLWAIGKNAVKNGGAGDIPTTPIVVNERQSVGIRGDFDFGCGCKFNPVTGGTFTISFDHDGDGATAPQTTAAIAYDATAAAVQSALEGLASVATGDVSVTGGPGPSTAWTIEFTGALGGIDHAPLSVNAGGLTPPGSSGLVSTTQNGSTTFEGPAEICTVATDCRSPEVGTKGGEFGPGSVISSNGGGNGIAVVPAGLPNAGNVLVTDRTNFRVQEFTPSGVFVRTFGADVVPQGGVGNAPNDEEQTVTIGASGGTFTLSFGGQTTTALPFDAPATDPGTPGTIDSVEEALNNLTSIKPDGSVSVAGGPGDTTGTTPYEITFGGNLADLDVAQITVNAASLLPGPGRELTCTGGPTGGTGATTVSYQWLANGVPAPGAGATTAKYTVDAADAGKAVQCRVVATHTAGSAPTGSTTVSTPLTAVTASGPLPTPPGGNLSFTGNATLGSTLTCNAGSWGNSPTSYTYTWLRNGSQVLETETKAGTSDTYEISAANVASPANFQCMVTATNAHGAASKVSANKTTPSTPNPPGAPNPTAPTATSSLAPLATTATALQGASTFEICADAEECKAGSGNGANPGQFGGSGTNTSPNRLAVDSSGDIYVVENSANHRLQKFTPSGSDLMPSTVNPDVGAGGPPLDLTGTSNQNTPMDVAVGPGDHLFVLKAYQSGTGEPTALVNERRVVELDDSGEYVETHASRSGIQSAIFLAINDDSEEIYVPGNASGGTAGVYVLGASSAPTVSMEINDVTVHTARLDGLVNPGGPDTLIGITTKFHFEYRKVGAPAWTTHKPDKDVGNGFDDVPVVALLKGLEADTPYEAKLVATKPFSGAGSVETAPLLFVTPASPPEIEAAYVSERDATSAKLNARINPNGQATTYRFEYGTTPAYGTTVPIPDGTAGSGHGSSQIFSEALSGLAPDTTYHFRVVATSASGTSESSDRTFTTHPAVQPPGGKRAYELVSPPDKLGGSGLGMWTAETQLDNSHGRAGFAAIKGDRFASWSYLGGVLTDSGFSYGSDITLGERTTGGWVNKPFFNRPGGFGTAEFTKVVGIGSTSDDFSTLLTNSVTQISIFPGQAEAWGNLIGAVNAPALREWESGKWEIQGPVHPDQQVGGLTGAGGDKVVAPGGGHVLLVGGIRGLAGPGDPTNIAFSGDPGYMACTGSGSSFSCPQNVYLNDVTAGLSDTFPGEGIRSLVNACTGEGADRTQIPSVDGAGKVVGADCPDALLGRDSRLISRHGAQLAGSGFAPGHISDDGSRVFFMAPDHEKQSSPCVGSGAEGTECPAQVYVRQRNEDGSVDVRWISRSTVPDQDASLMSAAVFEGATPDGDKVFFRTASPLTADDPNGEDLPVPGGVKTGTPSSTSVDLYMYDFPDAPGADPGDGTLTRISAGPTGDGDANVSTDGTSSNISSLRTVGDDGRRVYFTTAAPLAGVPGPSSGTITVPSGSPTQGATRNLYLYDAGLPVDQRWRFVAQLPASSNLGSCAAKGVLPIGTGTASNCVRSTDDGSFVTFFTDGRLTADDPDSVSGDLYAYDADTDELARISAPQGGTGASYLCFGGGGAPCYGDPMIGVSAGVLQVVTDQGPGERTAFFESASRLVPEDENDVYDVYQWRNGELSLISTGAPNAEHALYRGNDGSGKNVYISTFDRLSWEDHDAVLDVYAARLDGGFPEPLEPPACDVLAGGCQAGPAATPALAGASSSVFEGPGNFTTPARTCNKKQVRRGDRCVARRALARRACAKRKGKAKRRCVRKQVQRLNKLQQRQNRANNNRRAAK